MISKIFGESFVKNHAVFLEILLFLEFLKLQALVSYIQTALVCSLIDIPQGVMFVSLVTQCTIEF